MRHLKHFHESTKIKFQKSDIDELLIDMKDDFESVRFYAYDRGQIVDESDYYQLSISINDGSYDIEKWGEWSLLQPYVEEFIGRVSDRLDFKSCQIFQDVDDSGSWKAESYYNGELPDPSEINKVGWAAFDFETKKPDGILKRIKRIF